MSQLPSKCHDYPQVFDRKNGIKNEVVFLKGRVKKIIKCEKCAILEKMKFFG